MDLVFTRVLTGPQTRVLSGPVYARHGRIAHVFFQKLGASTALDVKYKSIPRDSRIIRNSAEASVN